MTKKGFLLIVTLIVLLAGALYLTPALAAGPYQAENATLGGGAVVNSNNAGFNGTGFVNFPANGGYAEFRNVDGGTGGSATLKFRNALAFGSRTGRLTVNGVNQNITFSSTGAWTTWAVKEVAVTLTAGTTNTIRLTSTGQDLANLDQLEVIVTPTPTTPPPMCGTPIPPSASISVAPAVLGVGQTAQVSFSSSGVGMPYYYLYDGSYRIAVLKWTGEIEVLNESPIIRFVSGVAPSLYVPASAVVEAVAPGTADLWTAASGEIIGSYSGPTCSASYYWGSVGSNRVPVTVSTATQQPPCGAPIPLSSTSLSVTPATLKVGETTQVQFTSQNLEAPQYTLFDGSYRIAVFQSSGGVVVYNESPTVRLISSATQSAVLEAIAPGTAGLKVSATGRALTAWGPGCTPVYGSVTVTSSTRPVTVSATDPTQIPPTSSPGVCSPVNATINVPFTQDGAGTFCWKVCTQSSYLNSWNLTSLTVNGVDFTNRWVGSGSYPPAVNSCWYISYKGTAPWSHFELR